MYTQQKYKKQFKKKKKAMIKKYFKIKKEEKKSKKKQKECEECSGEESLPSHYLGGEMSQEMAMKYMGMEMGSAMMNSLPIDMLMRRVDDFQPNPHPPPHPQPHLLMSRIHPPPQPQPMPPYPPKP